MNAERGGRGVGLRLIPAHLMVFARLRLAARDLQSPRGSYLILPARGGSHARPLARIRIALALLSLVSAFPATAAEESKLLLATTTSVQDSGLLDVLLLVFRERTRIAVQVVAVGSGAALRMGADGNADVVLSHDPKGERSCCVGRGARANADHGELLRDRGAARGSREGRGDRGPRCRVPRDRRGEGDLVSRGDDSGTHRKEKQLFAAAGLDAAVPWEGFTSTGAGMGLTLQVAGERRAYALSDIGTFLAYRERTKLVRLTKDTPALRNEYAVLRISPKRFPKVNAEAAQRFEAFLIDPDTQRRIGEFGRIATAHRCSTRCAPARLRLRRASRNRTELPRAELLEITLARSASAAPRSRSRWSWVCRSGSRSAGGSFPAAPRSWRS